MQVFEYVSDYGVRVVVGLTPSIAAEVPESSAAFVADALAGAQAMLASMQIPDYGKHLAIPY